MSDTADRYRFRVACGLLYTATLMLLVWSRTLEPEPLIGAGTFLILAIATMALYTERARSQYSDGTGTAERTTITRPRPDRLVIAATVLLGIGTGAALLADHRLDRVKTEWDEHVARHEARRVIALEQQLGRVIERSERAAALAAEAAGKAAQDEAPLFDVLETIRSSSKIAALAVFDGKGELRAWAGDHRGPLPLEAKRADRAVIYAERPLFGYLYVSSRIDDTDEHAVAAVLMQTGLPLETGVVSGFAEDFAHTSGERPYFGPGASQDADWSLVIDGDTLAHATFEAPSQLEWRAEIEAAARNAVVPITILATTILGVAWMRRRRRRPGQRAKVLPIAALTIAIIVAPLGGVFGSERLFSPALFLLPAPIEISLGRLISILVPLAAIVTVAQGTVLEGHALRRARIVGPIAVALAFTGALRLLVNGAAPSLLEGGPYLWAALFPAALLTLTTIAALAMPSSKAHRVRPLPLVAAITMSLALAAIVMIRWRIARSVDPWTPALWAVPFALSVAGISAHPGRLRLLLRWLLAGWIAATAVVPYLWVHQSQATLRAAEREVATLGVRPDPFLNYMLRQFKAEAERRHARGEDGIELLFRSWLASGMARDVYPARITLKRSDTTQVALDVGAATPHDDSPPVEVLNVPLDTLRAIRVAVRPRRSLAEPSIFAPLIGTDEGPNTRLSLVPATHEHTAPHDQIAWTTTDEGWRGETTVHYPDGEYFAHVDVRLPSSGVLFARAVLLLAAGLGILTALWALGLTVRGEPPGPAQGWREWSRSFRVRVTIALFAFFLLPTVVFGSLALRVLAGEADRTTHIVAERAARQAVTALDDEPGELRTIADRIGEGLLFYHRGELRDASSAEAFELGLFGAWMPASVHKAFEGGEELSIVETHRLGEHPYRVAYRKLADGTLAVPVSLATDDAAARQREVADLVLFAALIGALLSLALSVAVGRALAQPIGRLRSASAAVGAGQLDVRLPETNAGEFDELFASFNRMTIRLRQARDKKDHAARVLAWGEMSRQVAHEIKNPLTPIKLSVQHLRRAFADRRPNFDEILETNVEQILEEIDRLTEIARAFSRYGAPDEAAGPLQAVDVGQAVDEALTLYRVGEAGVYFRSEIETGLSPVHARPGEMKEVLLNLLENAYAALEGGGTVIVEASTIGEAIELAVHDDGPGVPAELIGRIFEPHFSTRSSGTGLGLAIVKRIVESWGGSIRVESETDEGTTIRIRLVTAETVPADTSDAESG